MFISTDEEIGSENLSFLTRYTQKLVAVVDCHPRFTEDAVPNEAFE